MEFEAEWARCSPWIEAALEHAGGTHDLDDVKAAILRGDAQFWVGRGAACVTEISRWPKLTTFNVWLAGGDLAELRDEIRPRVEAYGKQAGASVITITGRQGWARALGYRPLFFTCAKELT